MGRVFEIALTMIPGVGVRSARKLLDHFGTAEAIFSASEKALAAVPGVGKQLVQAITSSDALRSAEKELVKLSTLPHRLLFITDPDFPHRLRQCIDAPILLYYKGDADLNAKRVISVVGTRNATSYGKKICELLATFLKQQEVIVVSGLAHGIDVAMHQQCISHDIPTIGVLGHGLDRVYPSMHNGIAEKMVANGGLLTEFRLGTIPDAENFPKRNRIIAGMADAVVLVEASRKGGALITADLAYSYNRDIFAFPGRVNDPSSEGCNFLIKTTRAALVQSPKDIAYYLGWDKAQLKRPVQKALPIGLNDLELQVVKCLTDGPKGVDAISHSMCLPQSKLAMTLLTLEMNGTICCQPGQTYNLP